ncbi:MAG: hypothetical protein CVV64_09645 [Candidatus Wallbacteria bacterium HGW-Wallbacteria-1]|jgi:glycosyltransferase involved in cell wall biosynthesis|uniref:Glycosyl transferase family 1 domain-containing protein n=1 Tax=Candidatus Wallbacteria bacterium HGW-Wallbacteria-1 TaxID=2013854 RepID=A0A2N1PQJ0_9BACT|nr:MAG: hypothetical protein CVV64_09645 [Candidatus Wallbacteria bacterium HGW-Wallbacteria-1]
MIRGAMKPRVLLVSHSAIVPGYRCLASRMAQRGNLDISLVAPRTWIEANSQQSYIEAPDMDDSIRIMVERTFCWGLRNRTARNVTHIYPRTLSILDEVKPHAIYLVEEPYSLVTSSWIWASSMMGLSPAIIVFSGQSVFKTYPFPFNMLERYVLSKTHMFLPVNNDVAGVLRLKGASRTRVVPLGFDENSFRVLTENDKTSFSENSDCSKGYFNIGFLGTISRQKGIPELMQTFEILKKNAHSDENPDFRLIVVGEGELRDQVKSAEVQNPGKISFRGFIPHSRVPDCLREFDLLVVPSVDMDNVREQLGRVIIEAMACGIPVVGSNSGEIGRVIGNPEMVVPQRNPDALATVIRKMACDRDFYEAERVRTIAWARKFSWSAIAATVENHLFDAMDIAGVRVR